MIGMASTVGFRIGDKTWQNETHKTTLGRFYLHKLLRDMHREGVDIVVLEVSSHALAQGRVNGITFDTAIFTNLSREHLDYHRTMERYFNEKKKLFERVSGRRNHAGIPRTIIANLDDTHGKQLFSLPADQKYGITLDEETESTFDVDIIRATNIVESTDGLSFSVKFHGQEFQVKSALTGMFNVYNLLTVAAAGLAHGVALDIIRYNLNSFKGIPGRMEKIGKTSRGALVFIDYAVTPDSFEILYSSARTFTEGRVIAVFGACGDRDKGKRPLMGETAALMCDIVIVTNEEPYFEDPEEIIDMIWEGVAKSDKEENIHAFRISDREEAIRFALSLAEKDDTIIISGMGDQTSMVVKDKKLPWSDRDTIKKYLHN
jgi:UDP-N-acetylmuramyl-tripeptide synthetase